MMLDVKKIPKIIWVVVFFAISFLALNIYWHRFEKKQAIAFEKMVIGDSIQKLVEIVGSPNYETDGTKWVEPQYNKSENQLSPGCKRELWYKAKLYPLPSKWAYCFDEHGMLVDKCHWVSW